MWENDIHYRVFIFCRSALRTCKVQKADDAFKKKENERGSYEINREMRELLKMSERKRIGIHLEKVDLIRMGFILLWRRKCTQKSEILLGKKLFRRFIFISLRQETILDPFLRMVIKWLLPEWIMHS